MILILLILLLTRFCFEISFKVTTSINATTFWRCCWSVYLSKIFTLKKILGSLFLSCLDPPKSSGFKSELETLYYQSPSPNLIPKSYNKKIFSVTESIFRNVQNGTKVRLSVTQSNTQSFLTFSRPSENFLYQSYT